MCEFSSVLNFHVQRKFIIILAAIVTRGMKGNMSGALEVVPRLATHHTFCNFHTKIHSNF